MPRELLAVLTVAALAVVSTPLVPAQAVQSTAAKQLAMPRLPATVEEAISISRPAARDLLIGTWSDHADCSDAVTFHADGRFAKATVQGTWTLVGERLTLTGNSAIGFRLRAVNDHYVILIHDDGSLGQSIRC